MNSQSVRSVRPVFLRAIARSAHFIHALLIMVFCILACLVILVVALPLRIVGLDVGMVTRVIDGDTLQAWIPLRPGVNKIRLSAINAYETKTWLGKLAKFITQIILLPRLVVVRFERTRKGQVKKGKYGRSLGRVYCLVGSLGGFLFLVKLAKHYK